MPIIVAKLTIIGIIFTIFCKKSLYQTVFYLFLVREPTNAYINM